jgi:streptogramin lyase
VPRRVRRPYPAVELSDAAGLFEPWHLAPRAAHTPSALLGSDIIRRVPPGGVPWLDALATDGTTIWLAEQDSDGVLRLDPGSGRIESVDNRGTDSFFEGAAAARYETSRSAKAPSGWSERTGP